MTLRAERPREQTELTNQINDATQTIFGGWEDAEGRDTQTQKPQRSEARELERIARLGKARAALTLVLARLATGKKTRTGRRKSHLHPSEFCE